MTYKELEKLKKYKATLAKFSALALENIDKEKCLITLTGNKETYYETADIRKLFIEKLHSLRKSKYKGAYFNYFAVVEFGKDINNNFNPHLHIQCYYDDIQIVQEAYHFIIQKFNLDISKCDLTTSKKKNASFYYVVKNFLPSNYDCALESFKDTVYKNKPMYWSSRKSIPNYLIKRLYQYLSKLPIWKKYKFKYELILEMIKDGRLVIRNIKEKLPKGFKQVKNWLFKVIIKSTLPKTFPYKINNSCARIMTLKSGINTNFIVKYLFVLILLYQKVKIQKITYKFHYKKSVTKILNREKYIEKNAICELNSV